MDISSYVMWLPAFLFVITVVVFFHELGHFAMGRAFGVAVETFSIGFGRELIGWTDRKGTRWKICLLPLGGYVRFAGDADAASRPTPQVQHLRATTSAPPAPAGQVAFSTAGGSSGSVAGADSLPPRDEQVTADAESEALANSLHFKPLYQRALVVAAGPIANFILAIVIFTGILMIVGKASDLAIIGDVMPDTAAAEAGLMADDRITAVNGQPVATFIEFQQAVEAGRGAPLQLDIERDGEPLVVNATPRQTEENGVTVYRLGVRNGGREPVGLFEAMGGATARTWYIVHQTMSYLGQIIVGRASPDQLSGPLGIAKVSGEVAERGLLELIGLAGLLSVSIGLINLFPIPMLDGGHLLYYAFEAVGRPLGERAQELGFRLGLAFVLCLMLLATFNDLVRFNLF
jgi:regulator of sigma E protease